MIVATRMLHQPPPRTDSHFRGLHHGVLRAHGKYSVGTTRFDGACPELVEGLRTGLSEQAGTHHPVGRFGQPR